ncbi:hypothetical protein ACNVED_05965 [Legionella sp. D16C41]|uniref:hypothetical protein n=1 Tax=Legionella sp. D16C41 TaxID=3402688 RepID=UPI003AF7E352
MNYDQNDKHLENQNLKDDKIEDADLENISGGMARTDVVKTSADVTTRRPVTGENRAAVARPEATKADRTRLRG